MKQQSTFGNFELRDSNMADLPRESCHHTNDCGYVREQYYDGGDNSGIGVWPN